MNGIGAITALFLYLKIPNWLSLSTSLSEGQAGIVTFAIMSLGLITLAVFTTFFLHDGRIFMPSTDNATAFAKELTEVPPIEMENTEVDQEEQGDVDEKSSEDLTSVPQPTNSYFRLLLDGLILGYGKRLRLCLLRQN